jgi:hypothetical protein
MHDQALADAQGGARVVDQQRRDLTRRERDAWRAALGHARGGGSVAVRVQRRQDAIDDRLDELPVGSAGEARRAEAEAQAELAGRD